VKIGRLSSRDSFVSDAGDLKLDARQFSDIKQYDYDDDDE